MQRQRDFIAQARRRRSPQLVPDATLTQGVFDAGPQVGGVLGVHGQIKAGAIRWFDRLEQPQNRHDEPARDGGKEQQAAADSEAGRERDEQYAGVFRVVDLRAIAHEPGGAHYRKRAGQAFRHDEHNQRADNREQHLRLNDVRRPRDERLADRANHSERGAERSGRRQNDQGVLDALHLRRKLRQEFREHTGLNLLSCWSSAWR